jgi:hypothetical protein
MKVSKYVNGKVHTNGMENFWSLLKRGLNGTYVCPGRGRDIGRPIPPAQIPTGGITA